MISEPLFQDNIISTILRNFKFYFFDRPWYIYAAATLVLLYLFYSLIRWRNPVRCPNLFPEAAAAFDWRNRTDKAALAFLAAVISAYAGVIYSLDDTLFNNYDLMSVNTIFTFHRGLNAYYNITRLCPVSFFDLNFIYAVSHNFNIINLFIIAKQILIVWLLYRFLDFLAPARRLLAISLIMIIPAVFWLNNIIFAEQNILIFILASLIFVRKFSRTGRYGSLWWFSVFTLLAVFTKETAVIFYGGLLAFAVLQDVFQEKINLSNIFRPIRLARSLPLESMLFFCCLAFAVFYLFVVVELDENIYSLPRIRSFSYLFSLYKVEIVLTVLAWLTAAGKIIRKESFNGALFNEGLLFAGTCVLAHIVFFLRLAPELEHVAYKSYYIVLTDVFSLIYLARNTSGKTIPVLLACCVLGVSVFLNAAVYKHENGRSYREAAEFFARDIRNGKSLSIMFSPLTEDSDWVRENWGSALMYYFPGADITFKFPTISEDNKSNRLTLWIYKQMEGALAKIKGESKPVSGDYYIIKKGRADIDHVHLSILPHELVFENKLFRIYKIK